MMHRSIDDESLGMRVHQVNRERAVDRAIERLRHGLRADWHYLTGEDHANLRWVLGEMWSTTSRQQWEDLHFSKLDIDQTRRLVSVGDRLRRHHTAASAALESAMQLVQGVGAQAEPSLAY